jgi:hypothetical protein
VLVSKVVFSLAVSTLLTGSLICGACSRAPRGGRPVAIQGVSDTLTIEGAYQPVAVDRVDRLSIDGRKLVLHGSSDVAVELPAQAGAAEPSGHWALVTESESRGNRALTFTHETSLDDFTIEVPHSDAPIHYGMLKSRSGGDGEGNTGRDGKGGANGDGKGATEGAPPSDGEELMVFAWGSQSRSYWGYVSIRPRGK